MTVLTASTLTHTELTHTEFAPAERATEFEIQNQVQIFNDMPLMETLLSAIPDGVMILNKYRQIVYANSAFLNLFGYATIPEVAGMRPGEAINCEYAFQTDGGCGTTEHCSTCGAVNSILRAQAGQKNVGECRITTENEEKTTDSLDLRVASTPHTFNNERYIVFTVSDISGEKRRRVLERLFFHDITNTAGAIYGLSEILSDTQTMEDLEDFGFSDLLASASKQLLDEIKGQRQLMAAENGELAVRAEYFYTHNFLQDLINTYKNHPVAENKQVKIDNSAENVLIITDRSIFSRVIGNMIKNALEASSAGETITVGCQKLYDFVRIWVHNPKTMPKRVQLQIFQRSFSTKGNGRGLGTYSMKLFTEKYLQGRVSFESTEEEGTTFMAMMPIEWNEIQDKK